MELADGCQTDDLVHARDDANIFLEDDKGNIHEAISKMHYIFLPIDIFSQQLVTGNGASV